MARHDTAPSASGASGRLGPLSTRTLLTGAAMSSVKSVAPDPTGISKTRSRFVQTRLDRQLTQVAANGASFGSTSERNTSVPM